MARHTHGSRDNWLRTGHIPRGDWMYGNTSYISAKRVCNKIYMAMRVFNDIYSGNVSR